jgi:hypothetical protein
MLPLASSRMMVNVPALPIDRQEMWGVQDRRPRHCHFGELQYRGQAGPVPERKAGTSCKKMGTSIPDLLG